jgi:hypothetical protein
MESDKQSSISIESFLRENNVCVLGNPDDFGSVYVDVKGTRVCGTVLITLSWTIDQAIAFLESCGVPIPHRDAGSKNAMNTTRFRCGFRKKLPSYFVI